MTTLKLILTFSLTVHVLILFGQISPTITKKDAMKIAKNDTVTRIKRIETIELVTDPTTNNLCWIILEKVDVAHEQEKISKSTRSGMTHIHADQIKIHSTTGEIFYRGRIQVGSVHKAPDF